MSNAHIVRIERIMLASPRPRFVGNNSTKGAHGDTVHDSVVRVHTDGGAVGVGWANIDREVATALVGRRLDDLFVLPAGALPPGLPIDLPLWDLAAKLAGLPLYRLLGARGDRAVELYDGSIYIDDIEADDSEAIDIFRQEVRTGQEYGYHNFKIKIGRGARWMPMVAGLERDVLVINTVREAAGPGAKILVDSNNGGTLNSTKETLDRCADAGIYWFEEPFAENQLLNADLKGFLAQRGYATLIADGESGPPPPEFFAMVEAGHIDIVQHDFRAKGLSWWLATAARIEPWGARCAPHCWGSIVERYAHAHFAAAIPNFSLLEAAPADTRGVVLDGWELQDGKLLVPDTPGTGFDLEPEVIETGVNAADGFRVETVGT
jgi:L-alanine-DL-glutamate epimerase-like enolase superfamily enzyme